MAAPAMREAIAALKAEYPEVSMIALEKAFSRGMDRGWEDRMDAEDNERAFREAEERDDIGLGQLPINRASAEAARQARRDKLLAPFTRDCHIAKGLEQAADIAKEYAEEVGSVGNDAGAAVGFAIEDILRAKVRG
jgi:hypothetical protein